MDRFNRRTWVTINIDNLEYNINSIKNHLSSKTKIMAVVKADAYGHGDRMITTALSDMGIDFFAVSNISEAISLRNNNIKGKILILGYTPIEDMELIYKYDIIQTIFSNSYAEKANEFLKNKNIRINGHIKIDSGMSRLGFLANSHEMEQLKEVYNLENINFTGIFTHFSVADNTDEISINYTNNQIKTFQSAINTLQKNGINVGDIHYLNSAGVINYSDNKEFNSVYARTGIIMYGLFPSNDDQLEYSDINLKPVMELKSIISMIKTLPTGVSLGYGRNYITTKETKIATVPIGYADGYPRSLSNIGYALVKGIRCNIVGNVCMDQMMLDVTHIDNLEENTMITLIGTDLGNVISCNEVAHLANTINYEIFCVIGRRVPRVYVKNNQVIEVIEYIIN